MRSVEGRGVALDTRIRPTELETIWCPAHPSRFNLRQVLGHHAHFDERG